MSYQYWIQIYTPNKQYILFSITNMNNQQSYIKTITNTLSGVFTRINHGFTTY